mgnify:CR=1 FL=1
MLWRLALPLIFMLAPRLIPRLGRNIYLVWRLTFDPRVPLLLRLIVPASLVYFVVPIGIIPDLLPFGIGLIEDVLLLVLAVWILFSFAPQHVVAEHAPWKVQTGSTNSAAEKDPSKVVEGNYHVVDEDTKPE